MKPTAIVVDDERLAREWLRDLVAQVGLVEVIGEAADGAAAVRMIDEVQPDIVFLDIEIPPPSGLDLLQRIRHQPLVIFTTAFSEYAVSAFELAAVDYLLKPFDLERVRLAVERAVEAAARDEAPGRLARTREVLATGTRLQRLYVRDRQKIIPLAVDKITRFEAKDDYVEVHVRERVYLMHMRLRDLAARLDPERFLRVHRSHVVSLDQVKAFETYDARRLIVELLDGTRIVASRSGSQRIRELAR